MGLRGLDRQTFQMPFSAGVHSKAHPFALEAPKLAICRDAQFGQTGALQTRKPFVTLGTNILGGGTISNPRRTMAYNTTGQILLTQDTIYTWDSQATAWVKKGTHLAVSLSETAAFATTDDQVDQDRAELSGVIFYTWTGTANASSTTVYVAAVDKATGTVVLGPTIPGTGTTGAGGSRPRVVALQTKVLLFWVTAGGSLVVLALDPANVAASAVGSPVGFGAINSYYDAVQQIGADVALVAYRLSPTTSYGVATMPSSLSGASASPARTCDGPIAVACSPDGTKVMVVRGNGTAVQADLITISTLVDTAVINKTLVTVASTPVNQIAAAFRTDGTNRCYAFISSNENAANTSAFATQSNYCDTSGSLGSVSTIAGFCGVGSRAFPYSGSVYCWLTFGQICGAGEGGGAAFTAATGNFQNAYFLVRDDGFLCAKAVYNAGGGLAPSTGRLPGAALTNGSTTFSVALSKRRRIAVGTGTAGGAQTLTNTGYAMRSPQDVVFTFDSNDARRGVQLGRSIYFAGGECLQFDGTQLCEIGFHVYPWYVNGFGGAGGNLTASSGYGFKCTWRWYNAQGENDRSTTATLANATLGGAQTKLSTAMGPALPVTHKTANPPALEVWRTAANPASAAPFYLVTDQNPANSGSANNPYIPAPLTGLGATFNDVLADSVATANEGNNENGNVLPSLAPPAATIIAANADRVFIAGIAGDPNRVWYSKLRNDGEVVAFNDSLVFNVPITGGNITGLAFLNETLIVFRQTAIFAFPGDGYDNTGGGQNYGPARIISLEIGCVNPDAVVFEPVYGLVFKSNKGWYHLDRAWTLTYIGAPVNFADADTVLAVNVVESQNQIRCLTNNRLLAYNYLADQWSEWTISTGVHAGVVASNHYIVDATNGPQLEQTTYAAASYGMDVETAWIKMSDLQGFARIRRIMLLAEFRSNCNVQIRVARDYQSDGAGSWAWFDNVTTAQTGTVGGALQLQHNPSRQQLQAVKIRITLTPNGNGDCATLAGLAFDVGIKPGVYNRLGIGNKF